MADDDYDDPEQAMRETRQRFIAAFQHQCDSIALLVNTVASLGPRGPVAALKQVVHRMSGMAGTIGFPTVSQRASELEHLVAKSGQEGWDPAVARALVGALRESFTHDLASPPVWASASRAAESLKVLVVEDDPDLRKLVVSFSIGAARDRLADLVQRLRAEGINGVHAGVAGSPAPNAASLESLVAEADEALAEARHRGEAAAVKSDRPRRIVTASHLTVLIADDDPEITRVVDAQMRAAGYHTIAAFDGEQAMQAAASRAPDVVVLDLTMPKLSGFDVLGRLHQFTGARPSIVVLSARGQEDDVRRAFELGADDYITKPFDAQELLARVTRVLR